MQTFIDKTLENLGLIGACLAALIFALKKIDQRHEQSTQKHIEEKEEYKKANVQLNHDFIEYLQCANVDLINVIKSHTLVFESLQKTIEGLAHSINLKIEVDNNLLEATQKQNEFLDT